MINPTSRSEQPDSNKTVSGDPGAVHMRRSKRRLLMRKLMVLALPVLLPLFVDGCMTVENRLFLGNVHSRSGVALKF